MPKTNVNKAILDDETLGTPEHDKLILDLLDREYILKLPIKTLHDIISDKDIMVYSKDEKPSLIKYPDNSFVFPPDMVSVKKKLLEDTLAKSPFQIVDFKDIDIEVSILSEVPILRGTYIIGYWDIVLNIKRPHMIIKSDSYNYDYHLYRNSIDYWGTKKGHHTFCNDGNKHTRNNTLDYICNEGGDLYKSIYIEVKPKISSFGTTLRQLNKYAEHGNISKDDIYLYTPDTTFKSAFESQGIKVITPLK